MFRLAKIKICQTIICFWAEKKYLSRIRFFVFVSFSYRLQRLISLLVRGNIFCLTFYLNFFNIKSFALSIVELSKEARYICVVFSESCPIPALMTDRGMF